MIDFAAVDVVDVVDVVDHWPPKSQGEFSRRARLKNRAFCF